jgi:hypothetical protein
MPGMFDLEEWRLVGHDGRVWTASAICPDDNEWKTYELDSGEIAFPDLRDPATFGCLLALVREAWACVDNPAHTICITTADPRYWTVRIGKHLFNAATEAEALVAALEAAPVKL